MGPKKSKSSVVHLDTLEAKNMVLEYLETQYRPYSVPDLVLNLHSKVNKTNMIKVLDELDSEGLVVSKTYGKSVYYVCRERRVENQGEETDAKADEIKQMTEDIKALEKELKEAQLNYAQLVEQPSNDEASETVAALQKENTELRRRISELSDESRPKLTREDLDKNKNYAKVLEKILTQRKRIFYRFLDTLRDNVDTFDSLLVDIGIDKDEVREMENLIT